MRGWILPWVLSPWFWSRLGFPSLLLPQDGAERQQSPSLPLHLTIKWERMEGEERKSLFPKPLPHADLSADQIHKALRGFLLLFLSAIRAGAYFFFFFCPSEQLGEGKTRG